LDIISFKVVEVWDFIDKANYETIAIFINGEDLRNIIKEVELPFAKKENHEEFAGRYIGLISKDLKRELLDQYEYDEKATVLGCVCGYADCWPLRINIIETEDVVIWSDFEQPFREDTWDYSALKPFKFDKKQYYLELEKLG